MMLLIRWLNTRVSNCLFFAALMPTALLVQAQQGGSLSLEQAQELAQQNYPLTKQRDLLRQTEQYTLGNLNKGYLPQLAING
jgi:hypothetical protein